MTSINPDSPRNDPSVAEIIAAAQARAVADMAGATPSAELPSDDSRANYAHARRPGSYAVETEVPNQLTEREKAMAAAEQMRRNYAAKQLGATTTRSAANRTSRDAARRAIDANLG